MPTEDLHQGSGFTMYLDKGANRWLRENSSKLSSKLKQRKRETGGMKARKLKAEFLAHPKAQYAMTFQEYKDINKRDAICRSYGLELIRY
ncbi:hypothetical protein [Sphingorhabdus sp.]|uniref:hypothetical protein n=1 Tax=Sphingorhabdus sp. TaxID=1902408 RepID=UPI0037CC64C5